MQFREKNICRKVIRASLMAMALTAASVTTAGLVTVATGVTMSATAQAEPRRAIKVGLSKSMVIKLPGGVKDILVGDSKIAEVVLRSKRTMYLFARKLGQTNVYFLDADGNPLMALDVEVVRDPMPLQKLIRQMLPNASIQVKMLQKQVVLSGTVKTPGEAQKAVQIAQNFMNMHKDEGKKLSVINALKVSGKDQVMIKVKLAEIKRDVLKQFRINLDRISFSKLTGMASALQYPFSLGNALGPSTGLRYSGSKLGAVLQALERDGLMRLLAEPTLTAISGEAARFHAGGEAPVFSGWDPLSRTMMYKMRPVGILLGFTPLVLDEGRISLKVNVEASEISGKYSLRVSDSLSIPGIETRKAQTTVELPSGGTLAIAGMISEQTKQNIDGFPGLKNLPILGTLFRSREFQSSQSELVVMATPYVVNPVNEKKLRTPIDRLNMATDMQTVLMGRVHRVYGTPVKARDNGLNYHGNVGFILD